MVAQFQCRTLADLVRVIAMQLDQPLDEEGQLTFESPGEFAVGCHEAYMEMFRRASALGALLDRNEATISGLDQGAMTDTITQLFLPVNTRGVFIGYWVDGSGNETCKLKVGSDRDRDWKKCSDVIFLPKPKTGNTLTDGRPMLLFSKPVQTSQEFKIIYKYAPLPLIHGNVRDAGSTTLQLDAHESLDSGYLVGVRPIIYRGFGAPQEFPITAYDGPSQTATLGPFGTIPDITSGYTSRPDLHPDHEQAFILSVLVWMSRKLRPSRTAELIAERDQMLRDAAHRIVTLDELAPMQVRDDSPWSHQDPGMERSWY